MSARGRARTRRNRCRAAIRRSSNHLRVQSNKQDRHDGQHANPIPGPRLREQHRDEQREDQEPHEGYEIPAEASNDQGGREGADLIKRKSQDQDLALRFIMTAHSPIIIRAEIWKHAGSGEKQQQGWSQEQAELCGGPGFP